VKTCPQKGQKYEERKKRLNFSEEILLEQKTVRGREWGIW